jgi:hypothetical protein
MDDPLEDEQRMKYQMEELTQTIVQLKNLNNQWELKEEQTNQRFLFQNEQKQKLQEEILSLKQQIKHFQQLLQYFQLLY